MWNKTIPVTGSYIIDIPSIFGNNWLALEDITEVEHYGISETWAGRHKPGIIPIMESAATSAITAISSPATGALAQDTTIGIHKVYTGSSWDQINLLNHSRVHAYRAVDYTVTAGVTATIPFDTEIFDSLSDYNNATYTFVAKSAGFYYIRAHVGFTAVGSVDIILGIEQYDSADTLINTSIVNRHTLSIDELQIGTTAIFLLSAGDKIKVITAHSRPTGIILEGGLDRNFLNIYRLS